MNLTADAGGLIALERGNEFVRAYFKAAASISIPTTVLAQVWRSPRQVILARLLQLPKVEVVPLAAADARAVAALLALSGASDVVDAHVVLVAGLRDRAVVTSDPEDLLRIDPSLELLVV